MKTETIIWTLILVVAGAWLVYRATSHGMGMGYVEVSEKRYVNVGTAADPDWVDFDSDQALDHDIALQDFSAISAEKTIAWTKAEPTLQIEYHKAQVDDPAQTRIHYSRAQTIGIWLAAFFTLAIFSFLYKDNPLYKIAESVVVGVSAAYWMVVGFWDVIVPNLIGKLTPMIAKNWAMPGLSDLSPDLFYLIPLLLGVLLLMRLSPTGAWISRWPLAFIIGTTAGIRLVGFIQADFLSQIRNSIIPLYVSVYQKAADGTSAMVFDPWGSFWESLKNVILIVGVLACLVYFFFSFEHKGVVGHTARVGIWFLMITFGAAFGYTVMGRIALLAIRLEFLFDDWLWLIDPTNKRVLESAAAVLGFG